MAEVLVAAVAAAAAWFLWDSLKAREAANAAIRPACRAEGLLFLDDTVALQAVRPARGEGGRVRLARVYRFEYSDTGDNRRRGTVALLGNRIQYVDLGLPPRPAGAPLH